MNDETKRDRSPNYPKATLEHALTLAAGLYKKTGKAQVNLQVAVSALGYSGTNGAALTTIGALSQYGLIDRERGEGIAVSQLAIRLLHPVNSMQRHADMRESALKPRVFDELYTEGFHHSDETVITNHLIHNDFTPDGARKAAIVFKANVAYANLSDSDVKLEPASELTHNEEMTATLEQPKTALIGRSLATLTPSGSDPSERKPEKNIIASYSVPMGSNVVEIKIFGDEEKLEPGDFDDLGDFVEYCKKQYERKKSSAKSETTPPATNVSPLTGMPTNS